MVPHDRTIRHTAYVSRAPDTSRYPFFDHPGVLAFAHRGGAAYAPNRGIENSMRAFENAVALGYRYLETDVHATADGELIAFHDDTLDRVTDRTGVVAELPYAEISKARIGGREPIPRLGELLDAWPDVRINIDIKAEGAIEPLARVVEQTRSADRVCVASFSWKRLRAARRLLGPRVATSLAPPELLFLRLLPRPLCRLLPGTARCVQVPPVQWGFRIVTAGFVEKAHALDRQVHVWTIDDAETMTTLLDLGVDGIITDRIDTLREVLEGRASA